MSTNSDKHSQNIPVDKRTLRASNATLFHPGEAGDNHVRKYRRLKNHHHDIEPDRADTDTKRRTREQYKHHLVFCLGTQMGLNESQLWRARNRYMALDIQKLGLLLELVAICVLLRVMKADERDEEKQWSRSYHPNQSMTNRDSQTAEVVKSLKRNFQQITDRNIIKVYNRLGENPSTRTVSDWEPIVQHEEKNTLL